MIPYELSNVYANMLDVAYRKALLYGAPIQKCENTFLDTPSHLNDGYNMTTFKPVTAEQMIGWLEECGKQIVEICRPKYYRSSWGIFINDTQGEGEYDTREAATLRAIDIALQYLEQFGIELQPIDIEAKSIFRLPSKEEFDNLISNYSIWNKEKKGLDVLNKNYDNLFFPADGDSYQNSCTRDKNICGCYWSSTKESFSGCWYLAFTSLSTRIYTNDNNYKFSVRLVSDTPFEGCIEFDGVYWKPENEEGYYTFDEALKKFNK